MTSNVRKRSAAGKNGWSAWHECAVVDEEPNDTFEGVHPLVGNWDTKRERRILPKEHQ